MVVTRKAPAAPAAGRAGSTSAARPVKTRATAAEVDPVPLHVLDDTAADGKQDVVRDDDYVVVPLFANSVPNLSLGHRRRASKKGKENKRKEVVRYVYMD